MDRITGHASASAPARPWPSWPTTGPRRPAAAGVCDFAACRLPAPASAGGHASVNEVWGVGRRLTEHLAGPRHPSVPTCGEPTRPLGRPFQSCCSAPRGTAWRVLPELEDSPRQKADHDQPLLRHPGRVAARSARGATAYTTHAGEKLRAEGQLAGDHVFIRTNPFSPDAPQYSGALQLRLPEPTDDTLQLVKAARLLLERLYRPGFLYQKLGILLGELQPATLRQGQLFGPADTGRRTRLMGVMDRLNREMGRDTLFLAGAGIDRSWRMRQGNRSPRYTTDWAEIPLARA